MGTEVQSKMYLPDYYSSSDNAGSVNWSLCQQNNNFGQYHDFLSTRPAIDINEGHDKLLLRQTILKHESMFRHQLHELHRLYKIQRDMMNEMRSRELHKYIIPARTSQSSLYSSGFLSADDKGRHHISNFSTVNLNNGRLSMSGAGSIQCQFGSMKENIMQSGYGPVRNGLRLKECETLESKCKKLQRRLFDLELPAEEYINDEKEGQEVSGRLVGESYLLSGNHEVIRDRDRNISFCTGVNSGHNIDELSPNLCIRQPQGLSNFDAPMKVKEESASAATGIFGNISCSKEEMERRIPSNLHSGFQCLANKFSHDPGKRKDGAVSLGNLHLQTEGQEKGWLAYNVEAGQTGRNGSSLSTSFHPADLLTTSKSRQTEPRNSNELPTFLLSDQNKRQSHVKKKLFGVEICEENHDASVEASPTLMQHPLVPQSNMTNSESSSVSSWKKLYSSLGQNMITVPGNPSFSTFTQSNKSSVTLMQSPEVIEDKFPVSSNLRSVPGIVAEASQNELCISSQLESKESWVCYSSNGFGHLNGISDSSSACGQFTQNGPENNFRDLGYMMDAKSAEKKKVNAVPLNRYQNEAISKPPNDSLNRTRKQNPHGGLSWLKIVPSCNGNSSEERQGSSQMNLDSLPNFSQQFADKTEMMRKSSFHVFVQDSSSATCTLDAEHWKTEVGECSSNRKVPRLSIFEKLHISKDLPTPSSPSKPSSLVPAIDSTKACDPTLPDFGKQQKVEGLIEKGLINHSSDSRHHIDLNMCVVEGGVEEEVQPLPSSSRTKIAVMIDLEAPVVIETGMDIAPGVESLDRKLQEPANLLQDESREWHEGLIQVAAEALVAISSSCLPHHVDACCNQPEDFPSDPLQWFAEVISAYKGDIEKEVGSISLVQESVNVEHTFSKGMDYFEFMTLNLAETKLEEYYYEPQVFENENNEIIMPKRSRRGQARRGRQRKDFQRDVLPTLASLLKNEVTEDLQTIEGLIRATGGTWQSSLALKNTARNGGGKRKRRLGGSDSPPTVSAVCPPQTQPPKCRELALEETSLIGWGKRTRRPPRQRCPISSPPLSIK